MTRIDVNNPDAFQPILALWKQYRLAGQRVEESRHGIRLTITTMNHPPKVPVSDWLPDFLTALCVKALLVLFFFWLFPSP